MAKKFKKTSGYLTIKFDEQGQVKRVELKGKTAQNFFDYLERSVEELNDSEHEPSEPKQEGTTKRDKP